MELDPDMSDSPSQRGVACETIMTVLHVWITVVVAGHSKSRNGKWEMRNGKRGNGEMERQRTSGESV